MVNILSSLYEISRCSTAPAALEIVSLLNCSFSSRHIVVSHYSFNLHFPKTNNFVHTFICIFAIKRISLAKELFTSFAYFLLGTLSY